MTILEKTESTTVPFTGASGKLQERRSKGMENVETKVALFGSRAQVKFLKACNETRERIHRYPITSVFVGVGSGLLLGGLSTFVSMRKPRTLKALSENDEVFF